MTLAGIVSLALSVGPSTVGEDGEVIMAEVMHQPAPWAPAVMDAVYQVCLAGIADIPGASVDHNKFCVSVHYRNCEPKVGRCRLKGVLEPGRCIIGYPVHARGVGA
jgi:hypothetical protein